MYLWLKIFGLQDIKKLTTVEEDGDNAKKALSEVKDITKSPYSAILVKQMALYKLIESGLTRQQYIGYIDKI